MRVLLYSTTRKIFDISSDLPCYSDYGRCTVSVEYELVKVTVTFLLYPHSNNVNFVGQPITSITIPTLIVSPSLNGNSSSQLSGLGLIVCGS